MKELTVSLRDWALPKSKLDSNLYFKVMNDEPMMLLLYEEYVFLTKMKKISSQIAEEARYRV
jgi:hypothetical protein